MSIEKEIAEFVVEHADAAKRARGRVTDDELQAYTQQAIVEAKEKWGADYKLDSAVLVREMGKLMG